MWRHLNENFSTCSYCLEPGITIKCSYPNCERRIHNSDICCSLLLRCEKHRKEHKHFFLTPTALLNTSQKAGFNVLHILKPEFTSDSDWIEKPPTITKFHEFNPVKAAIKNGVLENFIHQIQDGWSSCINELISNDENYHYSCWFNNDLIFNIKFKCLFFTGGYNSSDYNDIIQVINKNFSNNSTAKLLIIFDFFVEVNELKQISTQINTKHQIFTVHKPISCFIPTRQLIRALVQYQYTKASLEFLLSIIPCKINSIDENKRVLCFKMQRPSFHNVPHCLNINCNRALSRKRNLTGIFRGQLLFECGLCNWTYRGAGCVNLKKYLRNNKK